MNSKRKGGAFEREIARSLSLWISNGLRDDLLWRSSMSGGRATIGLKGGIKRRAQVGDLSAISAEGELLLNHVVIEIKSYRELNLFSGIVSDGGRLYRFWHLLKEISAAFDRQPMLVAKQNLMPTLCLLPSEVSYELFGLTDDHVSAVLPRWGASVFLFDCFLREAKVPDRFVQIKQSQRTRLARVV